LRVKLSTNKPAIRLRNIRTKQEGSTASLSEGSAVSQS